MGNIKFCSNCGAALNGEKFCPNCGNKIGERQAFKTDISQIRKVLNTSKLISNAVSVVISILSLCLLFSNCFVISLGTLGAWLGYGDLQEKFNVFNLLFKLISLGKLSDESTALLVGILFALVLFGIGIAIVLSAIATVKNVYNQNYVGYSLKRLSSFMIFEASLAMIGVWTVKLLINIAVDEIGFGDYSSLVSDAVVFTNMPVIMIAAGVLIKLFIKWVDETIIEPENTEIRKKDDELNDEEILKNGGWQCICGKINHHYTETCSCGYSKRGTNINDLKTLLQKASLEDLILITRDQQDLYSAEEMKLIIDEIKAREQN